MGSRIQTQGSTACGLRLHFASLVAAMLASLPTAHASTIVVNDASNTSVSGKCSLPDAVRAVDTSAAVNGCAAGDGTGDTIDLSFFTIPTVIAFNLPSSADAQSALLFTRAATLHGAVGSDGKSVVTIARDAAATADFRVIRTDANLAIDNVNITGGLVSGHGAGLYASGYANIALSNSTISGNAVAAGPPYSGGGISVTHGSVTLDRCTVNDNTSNKNGGGIYAAFTGTIALSGSTVSGNIAAVGGGIYNFLGAVTLGGSTVSNNTGTDRIGGIYGYTSVALSNSTVAANTGDGVSSFGNHSIDRGAPASVGGGNVSLQFSTISGNTGIGVQAGGNAVFNGSILFGNSAGDLTTSITGAIGVNFYNPSIVPGRGSPFLDCDPLLAPLADNGGPTQTMALQAGSCAIDAASAPPPTLPSDQRGAQFARKVGAGADIGAFEVQVPGERIFYDGFGI